MSILGQKDCVPWLYLGGADHARLCTASTTISLKTSDRCDETEQQEMANAVYMSHSLYVVLEANECANPKGTYAPRPDLCYSYRNARKNNKLVQGVNSLSKLRVSRVLGLARESMPHHFSSQPYKLVRL